jgi:hypothetical protein
MRIHAMFALPQINRLVKGAHYSFGDGKEIPHICFPLQASVDRCVLPETHARENAFFSIGNECYLFGRRASCRLVITEPGQKDNAFFSIVNEFYLLGRAHHAG